MLVLEAFDSDYLEKSWDWLHDPEISRLTSTHNFTKSEQLDWYNSTVDNREYALFGIKFQSQQIGVFGFKSIDAVKGSAEYFGYIGVKEYIGLGLGYEILAKLINYATYTLKLKSIYLKVIPENIRAIKLYKKFGFTENGMDGSKILMFKNLAQIELSRYVDGEAEEWNSFISSCKNGLFLFNRNYMDYHSDRFTDHSVIFRKKGKIVAVFPAVEENGKIVSHSGLTFGSLLMAHSLREVEVLSCFDELKQYYSVNGVTEIIYKCIPSIYHNYPAEEDLYALFRNDAKLIRRDIASVLPIQSRLKFSESKRQSVRRCKDLNVTVAESKDFEEYWALLISVLSKFGAEPVHSIEEISLLARKFPEQIRLFEARKDGKLLAGIVIYDYGSVVHTQYMANSSVGRKIGALDYLNDVVVGNYFSDRAFYSFGISTLEGGKVLNEGLILQKEMMGGRGVALDFYSIKLIS